MSGLPPRWIMSTVGQVGEVSLGRQRAPKYHHGEGMRPYLRVANVFEDRIDTADVMQMTFSDEEFERYRLQPGDVLLNEGQSPHLLGRPAIYRGQPPDVAFTNSLIRFRAGPGVTPEWALVVFRHCMHSRRFMRESRITTNIAHLSATRFSSVEFPVPPVAEQRRIVAAIDEQFSRLDAGVAALERARQNLKRIRGAVLHQIIGYDSGAKLPDGWEWVTIRDVAGDYSTPVLTGPFGTALSRSDFIAHGVPVLTIGCLTSDGIRLDDAPRVSNAKAETLHRYALMPGDVLFSRMATVGRAAVVGETEAGSLINYHLMRLRLDQSVILPEFLVLLCRGSHAIHQYLSDSNHGVTRPGINTRQLLSLPVALPPIREQRQIVSMAQSADEAVSQLEREAALATARAGTLRSSILKTAFSGKLVPQDEDDELASALLTQIRAGRAPSNGNKPTRARKPCIPGEKAVI